jgi:thiamine biosynthesis lipoprotein
MAVLEAENSAVVTSGGYERNFTQNGKTYHHILDPRTGRPSESDLISATVIAGSAQDADAIATIIFILGAREGLRFADAAGARAVVIDRDKSVFTAGAVRLQITDDSYLLEGI